MSLTADKTKVGGPLDHTQLGNYRVLNLTITSAIPVLTTDIDITTPGFTTIVGNPNTSITGVGTPDGFGNFTTFTAQVIFGTSANVTQSVLVRCRIDKGGDFGADELQVTYDTTPPATIVNAGPPTGNVVLTAGATSLNLTWNRPSTDTVLYEIYRSVSGGSFSKYAEVTNTNYADVGLTPGVNYAYRIRGIDDVGNLGVIDTTTSVSGTPAGEVRAVVALTRSAVGSPSAGSGWVTVSGTSATFQNPPGLQPNDGFLVGSTLYVVNTVTDTTNFVLKSAAGNVTTQPWTYTRRIGVTLQSSSNLANPNPLITTTVAPLSPNVFLPATASADWTAISGSTDFTASIYVGPFSQGSNDGFKVFSFAVTDTLSRQGFASTFLNLDASPPQAPTITSAEPRIRGVLLKWQPSPADADVVLYRVYRDGTSASNVIVETPAQSFLDQEDLQRLGSNPSATTTGSITGNTLTLDANPSPVVLSINDYVSTQNGRVYRIAGVTSATQYTVDPAVATGTTGFYKISPFEQGENYTYYVQSIDAAGNAGALSAGVVSGARTIVDADMLLAGADISRIARDGTITNSKIAAEAITAEKIATGAITTTKLGVLSAAIDVAGSIFNEQKYSIDGDTDNAGTTNLGSLSNNANYVAFSNLVVVSYGKRYPLTVGQGYYGQVRAEVGQEKYVWIDDNGGSPQLRVTNKQTFIQNFDILDGSEDVLLGTVKLVNGSAFFKQNASGTKISGATIETGSIRAGSIQADTLGAIKADLGTITAGVIRNNTEAVDQGATGVIRLKNTYAIRGGAFPSFVGNVDPDWGQAPNARYLIDLDPAQVSGPLSSGTNYRFISVRDENGRDKLVVRSDGRILVRAFVEAEALSTEQRKFVVNDTALTSNVLSSFGNTVNILDSKFLFSRVGADNIPTFAVNNGANQTIYGQEPTDVVGKFGRYSTPAGTGSDTVVSGGFTGGPYSFTTLGGGYDTVPLVQQLGELIYGPPGSITLSNGYALWINASFRHEVQQIPDNDGSFISGRIVSVLEYTTNGTTWLPVDTFITTQLDGQPLQNVVISRDIPFPSTQTNRDQIQVRVRSQVESNWLTTSQTYPFSGTVSNVSVSFRYNTNGAEVTRYGIQALPMDRTGARYAGLNIRPYSTTLAGTSLTAGASLPGDVAFFRHPTDAGRSIMHYFDGTNWVSALSAEVPTATGGPLGVGASLGVVSIDTSSGLNISSGLLSLGGHTHTISNITGLQTALDGKQPIDADLTAIAALTGGGLLRRATDNTWSLDSTTYASVSGTPTLGRFAKFSTTSALTSGLLGDDGSSVISYATIQPSGTTMDLGWNTARWRDGFFSRDLKTAGGLQFTAAGEFDARTALYRGATDITLLRTFQQQAGGERYTILSIWPWQPTWGSGDHEATLALVRADNTETNSEFLDLYNNGYAVDTKYGLRIQRRGAGQYRDFVFDFYDGTTYLESWRVNASDRRFAVSQGIDIGNVAGITGSAVFKANGDVRVNGVIYASDFVLTGGTTGGGGTVAGNPIVVWDSESGGTVTTQLTRLNFGSGITASLVGGTSGEVDIVVSSATGSVGPGSVNRISRFLTTTTIGDSGVSDDGTTVQVLSGRTFDVVGNSTFGGTLQVNTSTTDRVQFGSNQFNQFISATRSPVIRMFHYGTSISAPTATTSGSTIGSLQYGGWGTAQVVSAAIAGYATENFSATTAGSYLGFFTTPNGTQTLTERWRINQDGSLASVGTTNLSVGGTLTVTGASSFNGNVTLGDANTDTVTYNARVASGISWATDNSADIGFSTTANRPRSVFVGTSVVIGTDPQPGSTPLRVGGATYINGTITNTQRVIFGEDLHLSRSDFAAGPFLGTSVNFPLRIGANLTDRIRIYPSGGIAVFSTTDPTAGNFTISGNLNVSGIITSTGTSNFAGSTSPAANANGVLVNFTGTLVENTSGTHARLSLAEFSVPTITAGAAAVTNATTVYIAGAPSASGATNRALWVPSGLVEFDGAVVIDNTLNISNTLTGAAGAFTSLTVGGTAVSVAGHTHTASAIQAGTFGTGAFAFPGTLDIGTVTGITSAPLRVGGDIRANGVIYASDFVLTGGTTGGGGAGGSNISVWTSNNTVNLTSQLTRLNFNDGITASLVGGTTGEINISVTGGTSSVGPGTVNRIPRFGTTTTLIDSGITDNGSVVQIVSGRSLTVNGGTTVLGFFSADQTATGATLLGAFRNYGGGGVTGLYVTANGTTGATGYVRVSASGDSSKRLLLATGNTDILEIATSGHVLPVTNSATSLGSSAFRFQDLWLAGNATISSDLVVTSRFNTTNNANSSGRAGIEMTNGGVLGFNESGVRSWLLNPAGGTLSIGSGDALGTLLLSSGTLTVTGFLNMTNSSPLGFGARHTFNSPIFQGNTGGVARGGGLRAFIPNGRRLNINGSFEEATGTTAFSTGFPLGISLYNNNGGSALQARVVESAMSVNSELSQSPGWTGRHLEIQYIPGGAGTSPGYGGFTWVASSATVESSAGVPRERNRYRARSRIWFTFWALIPSGRSIEFASNPYGGTGQGSRWITPNGGTGQWEQYIYEVQIGVDNASFSSTGFFFISSGADTTFSWYITGLEVVAIDEVDSSLYSYINVGGIVNDSQRGLDMQYGTAVIAGALQTGVAASNWRRTIQGVPFANVLYATSGYGSRALAIGADGNAPSMWWVNGNTPYYGIDANTTGGASHWRWNGSWTKIMDVGHNNGTAGNELVVYGNITSSGGSFVGSLNGNANTATQAGSISGYGNPTSSNVANTIVYRDTNGDFTARYIFSTYLIASGGNTENPSIGQIWTQNTTDNYLRKSTPAHFISQLGLITTSNFGSQSVSADNITTGTIPHSDRLGTGGAVDRYLRWNNGTPIWTALSTSVPAHNQTASTITSGSNATDRTFPGSQYIFSDFLTVNGDHKVNVSLAVGNINVSATTGRIDASNDIVAYSTSDQRLKNEFKDIENVLPRLMNLKTATYEWRQDMREIHGYDSTRDVGLIAQEVEQLFEEIPSIVRTNDNGYKAIRYERMIPLLVQAIRELYKKVTEK